jgi:hypothetical protein
VKNLTIPHAHALDAALEIGKTTLCCNFVDRPDGQHLTIIQKIIPKTSIRDWRLVTRVGGLNKK